jgi:hypothetical protein
VEQTDSITITVTGDFCPAGRINDLCLNEKYSDIYGDVLPTLHESDLALTNLECPLTDRSGPIVKRGPCLHANPKCVDLLKLARFDVVTLANNHIMDQGVAGLKSTIRACEDAGIKTVGVGNDLESAAEPLYIAVKGRTIAIINCAENEFSVAGRREPGANPLDIIRLHNAVHSAKQKTDTILVIVHGGHELYEFPSVRMVDTYRFIADLGVSAVIGHHTHNVSGYEWHNGVPIVYSLGNFLFDWPAQALPGFDRGALANLRLEDGHVSKLEIVPFFQCKEKIGLELMKGMDRENFYKRLDEICEVIADRNELERQWDRMLDLQEMNYMPNLLAMGRIERYFFRRGFDLFNRANRKTLLGILNSIQCEAHRDVSTDVLRRWVKRGRK